ncbi:MAG: hypothetical protein MUC88_01170 [Planctomycetes bacterium]|jgi:hypothetical protein|nr:hypothetical protein [Planctomycetota bacterium]
MAIAAAGIRRASFGIIRKHAYLIIGVGLLYAGAIVLGLILGHMGGPMVELAQRLGESGAEGVERVFGRFREPVREGDIMALALGSLLVFSLNMLGNITHFTLPGVLLLPGLGFLLFSGWLTGVSLTGLQASSLASYGWYLVMVLLELATYVLALSAGLNVGLSLLLPARQQVPSRLRAFGLAWRDAYRLYRIIAVVLAFQAVLEILYVRQVLVRGGTGVPLTPY